MLWEPLKAKDSAMKASLLERSIWLRHPLVQMVARVEQRRLLSVLFLVILLFAACSASIRVVVSQGWTLPPPVEPSENYTILVNTWKRHDLLVKCVSHYAACNNLDSIRVVWSESAEPPKKLKAAIAAGVAPRKKDIEVIYDIRTENSLNSRMKPLEGLRTDAVFSVDDDVLVSCPSLELAFAVWRASRDAMVGFVPRTHMLTAPSRVGDDSETGKYGYGGWWYIWWHGTYSMVLSKAAFIHHKYFSIYTNEMPQSIRDYVTKNRNCEDIAMSMLVANVTEAPPVWVQGKFQDFGSSGISSHGNHWQRRSTCLNDFASILGRMPLVTGHAKVADCRRHLW